MWFRLTESEYNKLLSSNIPFRSIDDSDFRNSGVVWVYGLPDMMDLLHSSK